IRASRRGLSTPQGRYSCKRFRKRSYRRSHPASRLAGSEFYRLAQTAPTACACRMVAHCMDSPTTGSRQGEPFGRLDTSGRTAFTTSPCTLANDHLCGFAKIGNPLIYDCEVIGHISTKLFESPFPLVVSFVGGPQNSLRHHFLCKRFLAGVDTTRNLN